MGSRAVALVLGVLTILVGIAACGSGTDRAAGYGEAATGPVTIRVGSSQYGTILVDGQGRTVYMFAPDRAGRSTCYQDCAVVWPPVLTGRQPQAGRGAQQAHLGTADREDGSTQVTYRGHPLYYYNADSYPGAVNGQLRDEFGAWYVLAPNGRRIDTY